MQNIAAQKEREQKMETLAGQGYVLDMHAHLSCLSGEDGALLNEELRQTQALKELEERSALGIATFLSAGSPEERQFLQRYHQRKELFFSFGIHPWKADQYRAEDSRELFEDCCLIGEIGLDSVWCTVPMEQQRRSFAYQLQTAADLHRPVILHTKGEEAAIAEMIRDFPGKVCVHWYSGGLRELEPYLEKGCYFTLGPEFAEIFPTEQEMHGSEKKLESGMQSVVSYKEQIPEMSGQSAVYRRILQEAPAERLFLETDGVPAAAWAKGVNSLTLPETAQILSAGLECLAAQKQLSREAMRLRIWKNLQEFLEE